MLQVENQMAINVYLTEKQQKTLAYLSDSTTNEVLFGGGAGGGKSWIGCYWILKSCFKYPETRWLIGRSVYKTLKRTTLNTMFEVLRMLGFKANMHYVYKESKSEIQFVSGSTILMMDLFAYPSDPEFDQLGSLEISGAFIDEANQITSKARQIVFSRIRYKLDHYGIVPKLLMTCNPSKNWVYSRFYKPYRDGTLPSNLAFVQSLAKDNPFISKHYIENLKSLDKASRERLLFGNWEYDDDPNALIEYDSIIDMFSNKHIQRTGDKYMSCDIALMGSDKFVIIVWHGWVVIDCIVIKKSSGADVVRYINEAKLKHGVMNSRIVYDADGVGAGFSGILPGIEFNAGARAMNYNGQPENYENLKTQCYYHLSKKINAGEIYFAFNLSEDYKEQLIEELEYVKRKDSDSDGKLKILRKAEVKEAIGRSPDFADAMMMRIVFELQKSKKLPIML